jgi:hypothetical protein
MNPEQIGITVGLVVAASLALQTALGPAMAGIVEAIKATGRIAEGYSGMVSVAIGTGFGTLAGLIACAESGALSLQNAHWIVVGAFAGLIGLGAGGVRSHLVAQGREVQAAQDKAGKDAKKAAPEPTAATQASAQPAPNITRLGTHEQEDTA